MAFHRYGKKVSFPRSEHVDIHVRELTLNADAPEAAQREVVEIREFIRDGEVYGHGIILPVKALKDLTVALDRVQR